MLIARQLAKVAIAAATKELGQRLTTNQVAAIEQRAEELIKTDPELQNEVNAEAPYQSRIAWGTAVTALGVLVPLGAKAFGVDISAEQVVAVGGAVVSLGGVAYTLRGRFKKNLHPLFSRR